MRLLLLAFMLASLAIQARADVYKCTSASGAATYQDKPCESGKSEPVAIKREPKVSVPAASSVYFRDCKAAKEAGAAPVRRGDPGYGKHLDRDGDGVGCE
jgi:hypothetical protein